jgi:hypothetical protein
VPPPLPPPKKEPLFRLHRAIIGVVILIIIGSIVGGKREGGGTPTAAAPAASPVPNSVDSAYSLCAWFDGTKQLTQKCVVSVGDRAMDIAVDVAPSDAKIFCEAFPPIVKRDGLSFNGRWQLRLFSPFSGNRPIASCDL